MSQYQNQEPNEFTMEKVLKQLEKVDVKEPKPKVIRNYRLERFIDNNDKVHYKSEALGMNEIINSIFAVARGFPYKLGGADLFTVENNSILRLQNANALFAYLTSITTVEWDSRKISQVQVFERLLQCAKNYASISNIPHYPMIKDQIYYMCKEFVPTQTGKLDELISFFNPLGRNDKTLIKAMFLTGLYFNPGQRPAFTIDSPYVQGAGKTKLAELVGYLYSKPGVSGHIQLHSSWFQGKFPSEDDIRRVLIEAPDKRVAIIDNVIHRFQSSNLATLITGDEIKGRRKYGREESTRLNDILFIITTNGAVFSRDHSQRSVTIQLDKAGEDKRWLGRVKAFIDSNQEDIYRDMIYCLDKKVSFETKSVTRFQAWDEDVLAVCCESEKEYEEICTYIKSEQEASDSEKIMAEDIEEAIRGFLFSIHGDAINSMNIAITFAAAKMIIQSQGIECGRYIASDIKNMIAAGYFRMIRKFWRKDDRYEMGSKRGFYWSADRLTKSSELSHVYFPEKDGTVISRLLDKRYGVSEAI